MLLEVNGICKSYRALTALDHVTLSVDAGEVVGLIGVSGSGKSTAAAVVAGLEQADAGTVAFAGASCPASAPLRKRPAEFAGLQMVFQNPAASFSERMRIGAAVAEGIAYRGVPRSQRSGLVLEALDMVGLPRAYADKHAWELSGGECQRAAIARAIVSRPKLLLADEPTSALDVTVQAQVVRLVRDLCAELGMACLFISHDLALVRNLCTRSYVIDAGRIVEEGDTARIFAQPSSDAARLLVSAVPTF